MKKSIEEKVEFLNGYLNGLSNLCSGLNFVPNYGADIVPKVSDNLKDSLAAHLSPDTLTNYESLTNWQATFQSHIKKLITEHFKTADWHHFYDLLEDEILSNNNSDLVASYFKSEGEKYEYTNEGYLFSDGDSSFMLYFYWSD